MTRPIYEPNPQRGQASLEFGQQQLYRRPAPAGGTSELPWARRSLGFDGTNQNVNSASITDLLPNHDYNMGTGESGEAYFQPESGGAANGIDILIAGVFLVKVGIFWQEAFTATMGVGYQDTIAGGAHWDVMPSQSSLTIWYESAWEARLPTSATFKASFFQLSGSLKHIEAAAIEVVWLGTYTGTEITAMDPDQ